jgi:hypothetical protein
MTQCPKCKTKTDIKDMDMKMGGLLCPKCRVILFQPYVDEEYFEEYRRRQKASEGSDKPRQEGT